MAGQPIQLPVSQERPAVSGDSSELDGQATDETVVKLLREKQLVTGWQLEQVGNAVPPLVAYHLAGVMLERPDGSVRYSARPPQSP